MNGLKRKRKNMNREDLIEFEEEIKQLFPDFQTIIHLRGLELDFHNKPHYHGIIYYL